jgi:hypothetical protein
MNLRFDSFACAIGDRKSKKVIMARLWRFDLGQHLVNDLETGTFEVNASEIAACVGEAYRRYRLEASHTEAQIWMVRIGSRYVHRRITV